MSFLELRLLLRDGNFRTGRLWTVLSVSERVLVSGETNDTEDCLSLQFSVENTGSRK